MRLEWNIYTIRKFWFMDYYEVHPYAHFTFGRIKI